MDAIPTLPMTPWPYPRWIAHRGAGRLAPENTLAAFRVGAMQGARMFECDVKLSADGMAFLLHDDTLDRTTDGQGPASARPWAELSRLDAGGWHSHAFTGEPLATLESVARFCIANGHHLNIEIKPSPGAAQVTGGRVAREAARLWQGQRVPPLLSSFNIESLTAAQAAAPELPRGLLLDAWLEADDVMAIARALECIAVIGHHPLWTAPRLAAMRAAGLRTLAYTVNEEDEAQRLFAQGIDGLITDRIDLFSPAR